MVRILVGAFTGPTVRFGASGFFWMNDVAFASPLYVPSAPDGATRVVPSRFLLERASVAFSSYQLVCLVASLELLIVVLRSAAYFEAVSSVFEEALFLDDAVTTPVFLFLRFTLRPDSSSEDSYAEESLSEAGGGVAARFLKLDLPLAERFLNIATGAAAGRADSVESMLFLKVSKNGRCVDVRMWSLDE